MPLTALFVLFEFVIHNPTHPETRSNVSLLDVAAGHFSHLEYASVGSMPTSCIAELAHIARTFVRNCETNYTGETVAREDDGCRDAGPSRDGDSERLDNADTFKAPSRELNESTTDLADMEGLDSGIFVRVSGTFGVSWLRLDRVLFISVVTAQAGSRLVHPCTTGI